MPTLSGLGPNITPRTLSSAGMGGDTKPPFIQARVPKPGAPKPQGNVTDVYKPQARQTTTKPVITPKPMVMGDQPKPVQTNTTVGGAAPTPGMTPPITPAGQVPPQQGGSSFADTYNYLKSDLQNETKQALAKTRADAESRGVFYGSPLTGSEADINTQYLRGLGQLSAGMYGNEQQAMLERQRIMAGLIGPAGGNAPPLPGGMDWSGLANIFSSPNNAVAGARSGPVGPGPNLTPAPGRTSPDKTKLQPRL